MGVIKKTSLTVYEHCVTLEGISPEPCGDQSVNIRNGRIDFIGIGLD